MVAGGPHPNAGRLWIEHMLSLETAADLLEGGAIPARLAGLAEAGTADLSVLGELSPSAIVNSVRFARPEQVARALEVIVENASRSGARCRRQRRRVFGGCWRGASRKTSRAACAT